jgi:hypothetical protein
MKPLDLVVCNPKTPHKNQTIDIEIVSKTGIVYLIQLEKDIAMKIAFEIATEFSKREGC